MFESECYKFVIFLSTRRERERERESSKNIGKLLELFDLGNDFSDDQLKSAYRDLVQVWHPDKYENNDRLKERAETKIKEINEAYGTLRALLEARNNHVSANGGQKAKGKPSLLGSVFHPTDFSHESDAAFAHALKIAVLANARLNLFHVSPDKDGMSCRNSRR